MKLKRNQERFRVFNREMIKYIAILAMACNHISAAFLERGTFLGELLQDIGYITAPVMCYFLVEGYFYTRSRKKYATRLFVFALISQIPFYMALSQGEAFPGVLNMMFSLFFCFLILEVRTRVYHSGLLLLLYGALLLILGFCDWPTMAPVYTFLFAYAYGSQKRLKKAFGIAGIFFVLSMYLMNSTMFPTGKAIGLTCASTLGLLAAAILILYLYNGEKSKHEHAWSKWVFYWFYPVHLLIIGILRMYV